jgi:hypothetical protein
MISSLDECWQNLFSLLDGASKLMPENDFPPLGAPAPKGKSVAGLGRAEQQRT